MSRTQARFRSWSWVLVGAAVVMACGSESSSVVSGRPERVRCDCDTRGTVQCTSAGDEMACSPAAVGSPAICCAEPGFLEGRGGSCSCASLSCGSRVDNGMTYCSCTATYRIGGSEPAASCRPSPGAKCCLDAAKGTCACVPPGVACEGAVVPVCTVDLLAKTCEAQLQPGYERIQTCGN